MNPAMLTSATPVIDEEVVLDDNSLITLPDTETEEALPERLRDLEREKSAAYHQMHRMVADIAALRHGVPVAQADDSALRDALYRLALIAEYRSGCGKAKVIRIGVAAAILANVMGCDAAFVELIQVAAPLHDVGEIALPDLLMTTPALTDDQRALMRTHCHVGAALLAGSSVPEIRMARDIALGHHERFDGWGYPEGLKGEDIPLAARIVAAVDCFDAMTLDRPYRVARDAEYALAAILEGAGTQFDPAVCAAFDASSSRLFALRWMLDDGKMALAGLDDLEMPLPAGFWRRFL